MMLDTKPQLLFQHNRNLGNLEKATNEIGSRVISPGIW